MLEQAIKECELKTNVIIYSQTNQAYAADIVILVGTDQYLLGGKKEINRKVNLYNL